MAFKGFFKNRDNGDAPSGDTVRASALHGMSESDKLALLTEFEDSGLNWFWATDENNALTYISSSIIERLGVEAGDIIGKPINSIFESTDAERAGRTIMLKLNARKRFGEFKVAALDEKNPLILILSGRPQLDSHGRFTGFRGRGSDVTMEHFQEEETSRLAKYDSLTGLANRNTMERKIDATITAFRSAKRSCAILMLDLDRFKQVNDTLGHSAGDELLVEVANRLQRVVDSSATVGRLGGDEFQILVPDMDDRGDLGELSRRIITMLTQPYSLEKGRAIIGTSIGIAIAPHDGVTREDVVNSADMALYAAKGGGRGQFRFYSVDLQTDAQMRERLEADLRDALGTDQISLVYQPVVDSEKHCVVALEAQMRWDHPERGEVSPQEFIPVAEDSRLILGLGDWAIKKACADARTFPSSLRVSVNISSVQFASENFVASVKSALEETEINPDRLELELKESVFLGDQATIDRTLDGLFKLGVRLTLDEFGTGFSSLGYLRRAPFNQIKIGENFTRPADESGRDQALIGAIVALANALDMQTVAVGIESLEMLENMRSCGVRQVQGYIFTQAIPSEQVVEMLSETDWVIEPAGPRSQRSERRTVFRRVHLIHEDDSYDVTLRNLSRTGAMIQGLIDVPTGTQFVVDFGGGQLAVATVMRSNGDMQGLEFEQPLVDDGAGGLCTRSRVSPYALAAAGAPLEALGGGDYVGVPGRAKGVPKFGYSTSAQHAPQPTV